MPAALGPRLSDPLFSRAADGSEPTFWARALSLPPVGRSRMRVGRARLESSLCLLMLGDLEQVAWYL